MNSESDDYDDDRQYENELIRRNKEWKKEIVYSLLNVEITLAKASF
ncbi:hypothetical protein [Falsibacillus pallidus]